MTDPANPAEVKSCCAALYESEWAKLLLGDSFHPGGLRSTDRLARLLGIAATHTVLDVACGRGASALYLARTFGCRVVGIDLGGENVAAATAAAREANCAERVSFYRGDGEAIPLDDAVVDVVICECAFCTFPAKNRAAAEFARVLRPSGRVGITDLTRTGELPPELGDILAVAACIADARSIDEYLAYLRVAGFAAPTVEVHDEALVEKVGAIRQKLLGADLLVRLGSLSLPGLDLRRGTALAQAAVQAIRDGRLGYALMTAAKPPHAGTAECGKRAR